MSGEMTHGLWRSGPDFPLDSFVYDDLEQANEWLDGAWETHTLILSGDGGKGKTNMAEALVKKVSPQGYWFLDDPDDLRELEGLAMSGLGLTKSFGPRAQSLEKCRTLFLGTVNLGFGLYAITYGSHM